MKTLRKFQLHPELLKSRVLGYMEGLLWRGIISVFSSVYR